MAQNVLLSNNGTDIFPQTTLENVVDFNDKISEVPTIVGMETDISKNTQDLDSQDKRLIKLENNDSGWINITNSLQSGVSGAAYYRKNNGTVEIVLQNIAGYYTGGSLINGNRIIKVPARTNVQGQYTLKFTFIYNGGIGELTMNGEYLDVTFVASPTSSPAMTFNATILYLEEA